MKSARFYSFSFWDVGAITSYMVIPVADHGMIESKQHDNRIGYETY
jgi:hypothetical protein